MRNVRNPSRRIVNAVVSCAVVFLIGAALLSTGLTDYYRFARDGHFVRDAPLWHHASLAKIDDRILLTLMAGRASAPTTPAPAEPENTTRTFETVDGGGGRHTDTLVRAPPRGLREIEEFAAAALFASFGLIVLWCGRDWASLWLGIFAASFGVAIFPHYGILPPTGMLVAALAAVGFGMLGVYALYALAETVTLDTIRPADPVRPAILALRVFAGAVVSGVVVLYAAAALIQVYAAYPISPQLTAIRSVLIIVAYLGVLGILPLLLLAIAVSRAKDPIHRHRALIILATTAIGVSGVLYTGTVQLVSEHTVQFQVWWFMLVAIPIGFGVTIPAYRVVEVKLGLNRILVLAVMTLTIGAIITQSESWVHGVATQSIEPMLDPYGTRRNELDLLISFVVACGIVLSFGTVHRLLDRTFTRLIFRRRDEGIQALHDFAAHRAAFVTARKTLIDQTVQLVREAVGAHSAAMYEECAVGYERTALSGTWAWPAMADIDDPAFVALRGDATMLLLDGMLALASALGVEGVALRVPIGGRLAGVLVVGPRVNEGDGPYAREELDALDDMARSVADALFSLQSRETAAFIRAVADGRLSGPEARRQAEALCGSGAPQSPLPAAAPDANAPQSSAPAVPLEPIHPA